MPAIVEKHDSEEGSYQIPTRILIELLLFVLGTIFLLLLLLIGMATAITKSSWWMKKKRSCQKRIVHTGSNRTVSLADRAFYLSDLCLSALSIHWGESDNALAMNSSKQPVKSQFTNKVNVDSTAIPLRFKPETLYGATTTVHRENLRKKSWTNLNVQMPMDNQRRASMVDSLSFLSASNSVKPAKSSGESTPHIIGYQLAYPQLDFQSSTQKKWSPGLLPQIDITCEQDSLPAHDDTDGVDDLRSDRECLENQSLSIVIPTRRASATNISLSNPVEVRRASIESSTSGMSTVRLTTDSEESKAKNNYESHKLKTMSLFLPNVVKRNSLVEGLSGFSHISLKRNSDACLTDDESSRRLAKVEVHTPVDNNSSERDIPLTLMESPVKLPQFQSGQSTEYSAGHIAICVELSEDKETFNEKLIVRLLGAKLLKSPRPWQKSTFVLRCAYRSLHQVQQATIFCKDAELGRLRFPPGAQFEFNACVAENKQQMTTMNQIKISIVECGSKWSTEKEHIHGTVTVQLPGFHVLTGNPEWYPISATYPVIRIKADLLVSLCRRPTEGFVSIGVHEIRNIELQTKGALYMGDLSQLTSIQQGGFDIHACLTYDGHLLKSKKSMFLQQARRASAEQQEQSTSERKLSVSTPKHRMSFSRIVSGAHFLQFSVPSSKKTSSKLSMSNYGIVLFVTNKLAVTDQLPADFVNQLKLVGAPEPKFLQAVGECFIADETTQNGFWKKISFDSKSDAQCACLWNEAVNHECSRVYQWLTTE